VVGGVLSIIGMLALFIGGCELALRRIDRRKRELETAAIVRHRLHGHPPPDVDCPWPRLEPEIERLRERGAL
jgi:hypothetical protein